LNIFMNILYAAIFLFILHSSSMAQPPGLDWFRAQGTDTEEHVHEGMQTSDGGYISIGHGIETSGSDDMLIIKLRQSTWLDWKQEFGTSGKKGAGYCITEVSDGFIAGGAIFDPDSQRTQRFLAKLDPTGELVWKKYYGSKGVGGIRGIDITEDGNIIATGYKNTPNTSEFQGFVFIVDDGDGFIMKLDGEGEIIWEKPIDAPQGTKVREIVGGYAICSCIWVWSEETGDHQDFSLIKTDDQGNTIWQNFYGGDKNDHLYDFDLTKDGGYILTGHTLSYGVNNWDYLLIKVDSEGSEEWHKVFGQPRGYDANYIHDESYGVRQTTDGGYVVCGGSGDEYEYSASGHPSGPSDEWKVYVVRTDSEGNTLWEGIYPGWSTGNNGGEYIDITSDGGYIIFVDTDSQTPPEPSNFGYLKTDPDPVTGIHEMMRKIAPKLALKQNYPNPFNPKTMINYQLPVTNDVTLTIYNLLGEKIATLISENQHAGNHQVEWDATGFASGIYMVKLQQGLHHDNLKIVLMK
jgi:hypothetical protein